MTDESTEATPMKVEEATEEEAVEETTEMDEPSSETEQPPRRGRRGTRNRAVFHASDNSDPSCRVYVGNLAWEVTWRDLKDHMKISGSEITRADVLANPDGRSKGCGIVEFATAEGAQRALLLNDTELLGRQIFVREDREDGSGGGYYTQQQPSGNAPATNAPAPSYSSGGGNGGAATQGCRVYVGNLSWDVAWQDLKDHMRDAGEVKFAEVMTGHDGRSKGCGIVEYSTPEEAKEAISTLTDTELSGRMIFVREDREQTSEGGQGGRGPRPARGGGAAASGGGNGCSIYVGNLAYETSWQDLKDHMRQAGNVDQANVLENANGRSKGCGIVVYQNSRDAQRAIRELQNSVLHNRPIFIREDRENGGGGRPQRNSNRGGRGGDRGNTGGNEGGAAGCQLFVNNLSYDTSWRELKDHFRECGDVERAEVIEGPGGKKRGFGTVRFFKAEDAASAIEQLNGVELQGRELEVRIDHKAR